MRADRTPASGIWHLASGQLCVQGGVCSLSRVIGGSAGGLFLTLNPASKKYLKYIKQLISLQRESIKILNPKIKLLTTRCSRGARFSC